MAAGLERARSQMDVGRCSGTGDFAGLVEGGAEAGGAAVAVAQ